MAVRALFFASAILIASYAPIAAQSLTTEVDVTTGYSTQDIEAFATQLRAFGDVGRGWRFYADATWAGSRGPEADAFGAAYPYEGGLRAMELYVEKTALSGRRLTGIRVGRYRTPFGISGRSDHAYNGFLRAPMIRYSEYWALSNNFLETGVDIIAGTPRLHGEVSLGVAQDQDEFARRGGLNKVVRLQGSVGPSIVGASYIRTRPSAARSFARGHAAFTGVDMRWMASGVQLRGEWIEGQPWDGVRTFGGYVDAIIHRPRMGRVTAVARVERLDYLAGRFSSFPRRYTLGARVNVIDHLVTHLNFVRQPTDRTGHPGHTSLDVGLTFTMRPSF